jgi:DNA-binding MarR family transcriptional regulator
MRTNIPAADPVDRHRAVDAVVTDLGRAVGTLRCAGSERLVRLGISMTHFHVLTLLRHHDAMPMGRLAEILDASMSSTTGIIDRMQERGLVERVRVADDRRVVLVRSTATGSGLVDEAELLRSDVMAAAMARLADGQLERVSAALADIQGAITEELESAPKRYAALASCDHSHGHHGPNGPDHPGTGESVAGYPIHTRSASESGPATTEPGPAGV